MPTLVFVAHVVAAVGSLGPPLITSVATNLEVSVASTIGIGVGYPLAGLLTEVAGPRAAYGLGLVVSLVAFGTAWRFIPEAPPGRGASVDVIQTRLFTQHFVVAVGIGVVAVLRTLITRYAQTPNAARGYVVELILVVAILGFGVGGFSAVMPAVILVVTPAGETSSAMAVNRVVRSVGFSLGSAIGGLVLAAHTPDGQLFLPATATPPLPGWVLPRW